MTHLYTLLVSGTVIAGGDEPPASAIAWAADTVIAIGGEELVDAISRGDSQRIELSGAFVIPLSATLEVGGPADLAVLNADPREAARDRRGRRPRTLAIIRGGHVVSGTLPGYSPDIEHDHSHSES